MFSLLDLRFALWSLYLHVLRTQRILGFFIVITHKSTGSENLITWCVCARTDCFCLCPDAFTELCGGTKGFKVVETFTGPRITGESSLLRTTNLFKKRREGLGNSFTIRSFRFKT